MNDVIVYRWNKQGYDSMSQAYWLHTCYRVARLQKKENISVVNKQERYIKMSFLQKLTETIFL